MNVESISIVRGDDFDETFSLTGTGWSADNFTDGWMTIRLATAASSTVTDTDATIQIAWVDEIEDGESGFTLDGTSGRAVIRGALTTAMKLNKHQYDIQFVTTTGRVVTPVTGDCLVFRDVTRRAS